MIRPISIQQFDAFVAAIQHIDYQSWLVGAEIGLAIGLIIYVIIKVVFLYISVRQSDHLTGLKFIPASNDRASLERMEEFFRFSRSLLRQPLFSGGILPFEQMALEMVSDRMVSDRENGIHYQIFVPDHLAAAFVQGAKSIFPGSKVEPFSEVGLTAKGKYRHFKLRHHPALPLRHITNEYAADPASFIASSMAELTENERLTMQLTLTPLQGFIAWRLAHAKSEQFGANAALVEHKLHQPLFKTTLRLAIESPERRQEQKRLRAITSAILGLNQPHAQELAVSYMWNPLQAKIVRWSFIHRSLLFSPRLVLSADELASLTHPASGLVAKAEDVATNRSKLLPLPTALKTTSTDDGVTIGYAMGSTHEYPVVLTDDDRSRHVYLLGQTGSGKSTILFHMARKDMTDDHGVAVIDPHGDLIDDLINDLVGKSGYEGEMSKATERVVLIDPADLKYPVGINLMELPTGITDPDELAMEQELVCEGIISVFKRVFSQEEDANAHRIEYILRNVIYTAFTVPDATIFTIYELINNPSFRKGVIQGLRDENLLSFWKNEFLKAGNWQQVKMVSGVTAKIGRFLFSPTVKRILEQPQSTINFDEILSQQKILLCNLSEGKIGEDNSHLMGSVIITKLHLAALRRARLEQSSRTPFYLYVDEFQHFATSYFTRLLSGGRKFGLRVTIAQQSTAQLKDPQMIQVILANTGTVIAFRTASSNDADLLLPLFEPLVTREDIVNLPRHHFYVKLGSNQSQPAFSGKTVPIVIGQDPTAKARLIASSRERNARAYAPITQPTPSLIQDDNPKPNRRRKGKSEVKSTAATQTRLA